MKIFEIGGRRIRAAVMISGVGDIGGTLVSQLIKRASQEIAAAGEDATHEVCVNEISGAIQPVYDDFVTVLKKQTLREIRRSSENLDKLNTTRERLGKPLLAALESLTEDDIGIAGVAWLAGHEPDIVIPTPPLQVVVATHFDNYAACVLAWPAAMRTEIVTSAADVGRVWWWGTGGNAVARVVRGYDAEAVAAHADDGATSTLSYLNARASDLQMPLLLNVMPLQEAVYFTEYLGEVACGYDRFKIGPAGVGGAVNVMIITDEERKWLRQDRIQSRSISV